MSKEGYKVQTEQYSHLFHILINFKIIINLSLVSSKINRNTSVKRTDSQSITIHQKAHTCFPTSPKTHQQLYKTVSMHPKNLKSSCNIPKATLWSFDLNKKQKHSKMRRSVCPASPVISYLRQEGQEQENITSSCFNSLYHLAFLLLF